MAPYETPKARAAAIKSALKAAYGKQRFSVRSTNRGTRKGWAYVTWTDGPTEADVQELIAPFADSVLQSGGTACTRRTSAGTEAEAEAPPPPPQEEPVPEPTPQAEPDPAVLHAVPAPEPAAGAQRRESAIALLNATIGHLRDMSDEAWEPTTRDGVRPVDGTPATLRAGSTLAAAALGEVTTLIAALRAAETDPAGRRASVNVANAAIARIVNASSPVLRHFADTGHWTTTPKGES